MAGVIVLFLLAVAPSARAQAEEPWKFLEDFTVVRGAVSEIEEGYVASVFRNSEKGLLALVIFPGVCEPSGCAVQDPVAYLVVDAQGLLVKLHLNPGTKLSSLIAGFHVA